MATDFAKLDGLAPLPPEELPRQWRLAREAMPGLDGWEARELGGFVLQSHPDVILRDILSAGGEALGWLIEPVLIVSADGSVDLEGALTLPEGLPFEEAAERALYGRNASGETDGTGVAGPWTAVFPGGMSGGRVYLGPSHSLLFTPGAGVVATSHNLIPGARRDRELSRLVDPLSTRDYYAFGLTAFQDVHRLLPNHVLELDGFKPQRHWPRRWSAKRTAAGEAAGRIINQAQAYQKTLAGRYPTFRISLSAGRDSRAVLAMLRPSHEEGGRVECVTTRGKDAESLIDADIAAALTDTAQVPHTIRERRPRPSSDADIQRMFVRIGEARAGKVLAGAARHKRTEADFFAFAGMAGETARGFYWGGRMPTGEDLTPETLVRRVGLPAAAPILEAARRWIDSVPEEMRRHPCDVLDLLYIEQRLGCWQAPCTYLREGRGIRSMNFMMTALALETMLRLEPEIRLRGTFQHIIVEKAWPALAAFPYNSARSGRLKIRMLCDRVAAAAQRTGARLRHQVLSLKSP